jgi:hypothetical protein
VACGDVEHRGVKACVVEADLRIALRSHARALAQHADAAASAFLTEIGVS